MGSWEDGYFYLEHYLIGIGGLLSPLEQGIQLHLLPCLTGKNTFSDVERQLILLPSRLGGLGIIDPGVSDAYQFDSSQQITAWSLSVTTFEVYRTQFFQLMC